MLRRLLGRYLEVVEQRPFLVVIGLAALTSLSAPFILRLELRSSLRELLPRDSPSVRALEGVMKSVGGVGNVILVIQSPDKHANERFADALAARLAQFPAGELRSVEYRIDAIKRFYEDHAPYYLSLDQLQELRASLRRGYAAARRRANPLFLGLDDDDRAGELDVTSLASLEAEKIAQLSPAHLVDDYYGIDGGRLLVMVIRPRGSNTSVDYSRDLIRRIRAAADGLQPASFNPRLEVGITGSFMTAVEEYETLEHDVAATASLCVLLVLLSIVGYFRRLRPAALLGATLLVGLAWTLASTRLTVGYFNSQTAFLGSIILGTGVNYGIILLSRYYEERRAGLASPAAMRRAVDVTAWPTLVAAGMTAIAFAVLVAGGIRSLSQFGFIGSSGIMLCWLATMTVLPPLTLASERVRDSFPHRPPAPRPYGWLGRLASVIQRRPRHVAFVFGLAALASIAAIVRFAPDAVEYDFSKLRNRTSIASGTDALDRKAGAVFKSSTVPTVIHLDSLAQATQVRTAIAARIAAQPPAERFVESTTGIVDLLPQHQRAKLPILAEIRALLLTKWVGELDGRLRERVVRICDALDGRVLGVGDLPEELARGFEDLQGRRGTVVYVNPVRTKYFSDGHNLIGFASTIRGLKLADGTVVDAAGDPTVFADLIEVIRRQAPFLTLASFLAVVAVVFAAMRKLRHIMLMMLTLATGILLMLGICSVMQLRINFFNFIVVPLTVGIGADYAINVLMRLLHDREHSLAHMLRHTGGAVALCSLTTIIGYFVLTRANNQALASFGKAAIVGELSCVIAALFLAPVLVALQQRAVLPRHGFSSAKRRPGSTAS